MRLLFLFSFFLIFCSSSAWAGCACSSGCPTGYAAARDNSHLTGNLVKYVKSIIDSYSVPPISCYRARACQERLFNCFNKCGQRGRAAPPGRSYHEKGRACDYSPKLIRKTTLTKKAPNYFGRSYRLIQHKSSHGGGYHMEDRGSGSSGGGGSPDNSGGHETATAKPKSQRIRDYINGVCKKTPCTKKFWCSPSQRKKCN